MTKTTYRKGSLEARLDSLLPDWPAFDVIAHELWGDGEGGWSVNDSWHLGRGCSREEAITHLRHRWEAWKLNYYPKARVADLEDCYDGCYDDAPLGLEVNCVAFAEVRKSE